MNSPMTVIELTDAFVNEWVKTIKSVESSLSKRRKPSALRDVVTLYGDWGGLGGNYVNYAGSRHLDMAADLLLKQHALQQKLTHRSARQALVDGFCEQRKRAKSGRNTSVESLLAFATRRLEATKRLDGLYIFPVLFAPQARKTDSRIGPVRIVARRIFQRERAGALKKADADDGFKSGPTLAARWNAYAEQYDHIITVEIKGFEREMAWETAREAAEFVLNLIRMVFRFPWTDDIKLTGGFMGEKTGLRCSSQATVTLCRAGVQALGERILRTTGSVILMLKWGNLLLYLQDLLHG